MTNQAADAWCGAQSRAKTIADNAKVGDIISYDDAEEIGEIVWSELRGALSARGLKLVDEGDGHEVMAVESE